MLWTRKMADRAVEVATGSAHDDAAERIRAYFRVISQPVGSERELTRQMMLGWTAAAGPIRYESQLLADLGRLLEEGQRRGQIRASVVVATAARTLSAVYMGVVFRWVREQDERGILQVVAKSGVDLLRYPIDVTLDGCVDDREFTLSEELHRCAVETIARGPNPGPFARSIDVAWTYVVSSTLEFDGGVVTLRYVPRRDG